MELHRSCAAVYERLATGRQSNFNENWNARRQCADEHCSWPAHINHRELIYVCQRRSKCVQINVNQEEVRPCLCSRDSVTGTERGHIGDRCSLCGEARAYTCSVHLLLIALREELSST